MEYYSELFSAIICCKLILTLTMAMQVDDQCKQVENIDCSNSYKPEGNETVCCSDMKVYKNLCFFAQQKCRDPSLTVLHPGNCVFITPPSDVKPTTPRVVTTSSKPLVTVATMDPILEAFCDNRDEISCDDDIDPVCGTDDKFYRNSCEFAKARCDNINLGSQTLGVCKTLQRFRKLLQLH